MCIIIVPFNAHQLPRGIAAPAAVARFFLHDMYTFLTNEKYKTALERAISRQLCKRETQLGLFCTFRCTCHVKKARHSCRSGSWCALNRTIIMHMVHYTVIICTLTQVFTLIASDVNLFHECHTHGIIPLSHPWVWWYKSFLYE